MVSYLKILRKHETQMMKKLLIILLLLPIFAFSQSNLVQWSNSDFTPTYFEHHISALKIRGNGNEVQNLVWAENNKMYGYKAPAYASKKSLSNYIEFAVSPEMGYQIEKPTFLFNIRTQSGSALMQVQYATSNDFKTSTTLQSETEISSSYKDFKFKIPTNIRSGETLYIRVYIYDTYDAVHLKYNAAANFSPTLSGTVSLETPIKPKVNDDIIATLKNKKISIDVLANDDYQYSGSLVALSPGTALHGTVKANGLKEIVYTPNAGYLGYDHFYYTVTNSAGESAKAKVEVQVIEPSNAKKTPLVRWNKDDFTAKNYTPDVKGAMMTAEKETLKLIKYGSSLKGSSFELSDLPKPFWGDGTNGNRDSSKYLQFSLETAGDKLVYLNEFTMKLKGVGAGNMTIQYSKSSDFTGPVFTFKEVNNIPYTDEWNDIEAKFPTGTALFPSETLYIRLYTFNTYDRVIIDFEQDKESGPAVMGIVSWYAPGPCQQTVTWDGITWSGLPTLDKKVIISADYDTKIHGGFEACTLTIDHNARLSVEAENTVKVQNEILTMDGSTLIVRNEANLIQINDAAVNTGNITVERKANLKRLDYIYWASPVKGQNLKQFSPGTVDTRFYTYNEANNLFESINPKNTVFGNNAISFESEAKGYAIRASNYYPVATATADAPMQVFNAVFKGVPNNGAIDFSLKYQTKVGKSVGNGHNMIGNPYPSNIDFDQLVDDNKDLIKGTAYFWTNINPNPSMQGGSYPKEGSVNNYAVLNGAGSIPATQGRVAGLKSKRPTNVIEVGQGFLVQAKKEGVLTFKNAYRTDATDGVFFNKGAQGKGKPAPDRYWLELKTPLDVVTTALVAYVEKATDEYEDRYDAPLLSLGSDALFTKVDDHRLGIQGRGYPLQKTDVVNLGAGFYEAGEYTLSISSSEGVFENEQTIYLKDKQTGVVVNLTEDPYTFTAEKGLDDDRFELLYQVENTLETIIAPKDQLVVYPSEDNFVVRSKIDKITSLEIYDISGRLLTSLKPHQKETRVETSKFAKGTYILKITTASLGNQNETVVVKKIMK